MPLIPAAKGTTRRGGAGYDRQLAGPSARSWQAFEGDDDQARKFIIAAADYLDAELQRRKTREKLSV